MKYPTFTACYTWASDGVLHAWGCPLAIFGAGARYTDCPVRAARENRLQACVACLGVVPNDLVGDERHG